MRKYLLPTVAMFAAGSLAVACAGPVGDDDADPEQLSSVEQPLSLSGHDLSVLRGAKLFTAPFAGTNGNGRACSTCHVPTDGFGLTPARVEARWQALQAAKKKNPNADDPLFRSIDADDFQSDFTTLRKWGLVRVNIDLAPNVRLLDDPTARTVSVWRSTPTVFNVALTAPYQLDARVPTLELQALGALHGHAQITSEPSAAQLDDVSAFQKLVFPNVHSYKVAKAVQDGTPIPAEPTVTGAAAVGKAVFERECFVCHAGPAMNQVLLPPEVSPGDIFVSRPLPPFADPAIFLDAPPLAVRMWAVTLPDGSEMIRPSTDPGKVLVTGNPLNFGEFDSTQLRGLSKTAPYFHDNSAKTLRDVAKHYQSLFITLRSVGAPVGFINDDEIDPLVAYMNTL